MEVQSSNPIQDAIQNLILTFQEQHSKENTKKLLSFAQQAIHLFNEDEINRPGQQNLQDYSQFLLAHLILLDTNNARYLWKRIPLNFKDSNITENKQLKDIWEIGKALSKQNYESAFQLIDLQISQQSDNAQQLLKVLQKLLREEHILRKAQKAYSSIPFNSLKSLIGMKDFDNQEVTKFLEQKGWEVKNGFVYPLVEVSTSKKFELNEDRVNQLSKIVQFLEQQKYDIEIKTNK